MTAPGKEQFSNNGVTTLNGTINASTTSVVVASGGVFPATGNFRIKIDAEIMLATARSGNTLTVVRAQEGTSGASHSTGTSVTQLITAGGFSQWGKDSVPLFRYNLGMSKIVSDDANSTLTASSFTWINQGSATSVDQNGSILLTMPTAAGFNNRGLELTAPSTPYAYIIGMQMCGPRGDGGDTCFALAGFRESSSNELSYIAVGTNSGESKRLSCQNWNSPTSFNSVTRAIDVFCLISPVVWFKVEDNGTNYLFHVGMDGKNWVEVFSAGRTSFMAGGPDRVFWGGTNHANTHNTALYRLVHWSRE